MIKKFDYSIEVGLTHNERAATVDLETGEVSIQPVKANNIPEDCIVFEPDAFFQKPHFTKM